MANAEKVKQSSLSPPRAPSPKPSTAPTRREVLGPLYPNATITQHARASAALLLIYLAVPDASVLLSERMHRAQ